MNKVTDLLSADLKKLLLEDLVLVAAHGADLSMWPGDVVRRQCCTKLSIPWIEPTMEMIDAGLFREMAPLCREHRFLPCFKGNISLHVLMAEPFHAPSIRALRNLFHSEIHPIGTSDQALDRSLVWLEMTTAASQGTKAPALARVINDELLSWRYRESEGVKFIERILQEAYKRGTSDVFLESYPDRLDVRFKIGGKCVVMPPVSSRQMLKVLSDAKAFGGMATRESRGYRGGATSLQMPDGNGVDFRLEAQKTLTGESITLRLLDKNVLENLSQSLPFPPAESAIVRDLLTKNEGLIVVCGPTGSGKTTTLWRCLLSLDASEMKIVTIEDPVEYRFDRFVQLPVKGKASADGADNEERETFSGAIRSCLRAAPDIILVGEIRDNETADAAIEASLTGHLILSTLHTPDSIGVIPRLLDKKVSALNLRQSLLGVIAQRLAPKLCPNCRVPLAITDEVVDRYRFHGLPVPAKLYNRGGCPECGNTGIKGRVPVFELFVPDEEMRAEIRGAETFNEIHLRELWRARGGVSLGKYSLGLAADGLVSYHEARRLDRAYIPGIKTRAI